MVGSTLTNFRTFQLEDLVRDVLSGYIRIPDFQRKFHWRWEDVNRLMDSIVRGYPIGSLLLWERPAPEDTLKIGALEIEAPSLDEALWVIDGQQRLISLANVLKDSDSKDPRFAIAYDLACKKFVTPVDEQIHVVGLPTVFDLQRLLKWFSEHPESASYFEEATRVARAIREYSIPVCIVRQEDEEVLRDIFYRINSYGKRLTQAEVFSALHGELRENNESQTLADIILNIGATYLFGEIDDNTVLSAILARRGSDVTRDIRAEFSQKKILPEFPDESPEEAYIAGEKALSKAVNFLQCEAGVPHFSFLPYRYLLVVLTRFFAHYPEPEPRSIELLKRWFWRAAVIGPEAFSTWTKASRILCSKIIPNNESKSVTDLLKAVSSDRKDLNLSDFNSTAASTRILLCAMWAHQPRSFLTAEPYLQEDLGRILEEKQTAKDIVETIQPLGKKTPTANRFIFLGEDSVEHARDIFFNRPITMSSSSWTHLLDSHIFDDAMRSYLIEGSVTRFLELRENRLKKITEKFLESMIKDSFEDTPPLSSFIIDEDDDEALVDE